MSALAAIVLAAGQGKRMRSPAPKVLVPTREKPLLHHVLTCVSALAPNLTVLVTGVGKETVEKSVNENFKLKCHFAFQEKQLGTGDAVKSALPFLKDFVGTVLILCGDVPLVKSDTLKAFLSFHQQHQATVSLISFRTDQPNQYGRIIRDQKNSLQRVVEAKDLKENDFLSHEYNASIYAVDSAFLKPAIESLQNDNAQKEYYLTDIVEKAQGEGQRVCAYLHNDAAELQGVNTPQDLNSINQYLRNEQVRAYMEAGVLFSDPQTFYADAGVEIAEKVSIGPNVVIKGKTTIGVGAKIEGTAYLNECEIHENAHIKFGVRAESAIIGKNAAVGPFAHLRPGTKLSEEVKIGNFVETKNAFLAPHSKASHLTYLGDCEVGENSNIGAGTITCNYDGAKKHKTIIGKDVFVGSNTSLVAPVVLGDEATIGAGSVITKNVEAGSLGLARSPQISKPGWAKKRKKH